jgi:hypothetical protein
MEIFTSSKKLAPNELEISEKIDTTNKYHPKGEVQVKAVDLETCDHNMTTLIYAGLDPN